MGAKQALEAIWAKRAKAFRKETLPYFRYMGQSGFPAFMSLLFISSAIGYFSLIRNLPEQFPVTAAGVISLTLAICWCPLRTWLEPGDTVFLMPRESDMGGYIRRSLRHTSIGCAILAGIVLLLYLPIYRQGAAPNGAWPLTLAAAGLKAGNVWGAWRERRMAWPGMRLSMRVLRWALTALVLSVWLTNAAWQAALFTVISCLLFMLLHRLPVRHRLPWERLIFEEARTRKRYYVFFGMFIDVPTLPSRTARRSYAAWLLRFIPYAGRNTFVYLYAAALVRTEIGGIVVRLLALGCLVTYWLADAASLAGWGAMLVFVLFTGVAAVQLGSLRHVHRYSVWKHVYPLPEKQRVDQYALVDRLALLVCSLLLWLSAAIPLAVAGLYVPLAAGAACALAYIAIRPSRMRRKLQQDAEEE
ncbi:ABC transporter permease [Paenibacillus sp. N4]|uniref:ABC transporter permease n=1 Tax=Paenibacillus vietnamensis TaxID=2590547 RepID=UPI001CD05116|nr:ABC transporter permease [Paenibacillus vietnamensis]MCA0755359.1 ABC transporter permease [Paenibacillus vietnamensis]